MNKLELLKIAEEQDVEAYEEQDFEADAKSKENKQFKDKYYDFYDDVKQPSKYIKEDW